MSNNEFTEQNVLQVLDTMYSNGNDSIKKEANNFLESFQKSVGIWFVLLIWIFIVC